MSIQEIVESDTVKSVMESYRSMCFWSYPEDFLPRDRSQLLMALDSLERYGDAEAYCQAGEIRRWL